MPNPTDGMMTSPGDVAEMLRGLFAPKEESPADLLAHVLMAREAIFQLRAIEPLATALFSATDDRRSLISDALGNEANHHASNAGEHFNRLLNRFKPEKIAEVKALPAWQAYQGCTKDEAQEKLVDLIDAFLARLGGDTAPMPWEAIPSAEEVQAFSDAFRSK